MPVVYYNTETKDNKYFIWPHDKAALPSGQYHCFEEKIDNPYAPRKNWDRIVNMASVAKHKNKHNFQSEPFVVMIDSIEALQVKDKAHFDKLIGEIIKHGAFVQFAKENASFSKDYPNGLSDTKEFSLAMAQLEAKSAKKDKSQRVTLPKDLPAKRNVIEI